MKISDIYFQQYMSNALRDTCKVHLYPYINQTYSELIWLKINIPQQRLVKLGHTKCENSGPAA